jgi:WD40 repeat protein
MRARFIGRLLTIALGTAIPLALYFVLAARMSWRPHTLPVGAIARNRHVEFVVWSPTDYLLAVGVPGNFQRGAHYGFQIQLWDTKSRSLLHILKADYRVNSAAFSPDGSILAADINNYGFSQGMQLWNTHSGRLVHTVLGAGDMVFSADARQVVCGHTDQWSNDESSDFAAWTIASGKVVWSSRVKEPRGRYYYGYSTSAEGPPPPQWALSPDIHHGAVALLQPKMAPPYYVVDNGGVLLFDARTGKHEAVLAPTQRESVVNSLQFSPDGLKLALAHRWMMRSDNWTGGEISELQVWQLPIHKTGALHPHLIFQRRLHGSTDRANFSPDSSLLATQDIIDSYRVRLWDVRTGKQVLETFGSARTPAFSPDNTLLALSYDKVIRLWNTRDGHLMREFAAHEAAITDLAFSPDGATLASSSSDGTVKLWRIK